LHVDVAFWGGAVPGSEEHLSGLNEAGVMGFKAFLCDSGVPEYAAFAPGTVADLLARTAALDVPLIVHAEDPGGPGGASPCAERRPPRLRTWLDLRPPEAEVAAIGGLIAAARATGGRVHVLHLSAADALADLRAARADGLAVTVETCPHYLTLAAEDIPDGATDHKCAPPIRDRANQERLWAALADGTIDAIVSDHSPAPPDVKALADGDLLTAWGGIASLQLGLPVIWTAARDRGFDLTDVTRWLAAGPARVAGLTRKGAIAPGKDADLVVFDPDRTWQIDAAAPGAPTPHHPLPRA
jgi:allantoinase